MRKMTWMRWGLASIVLAGTMGGALAAGCSDEETPPVTPKDSGKDTTTTGDTGTDTGTTDAGDAGVERGKVIAVHATNALSYLSPAEPLGGIRFCFATGQNDDGSDAAISPLPPLPYDDTASAAAGLPYPMLPEGTGGPLPSLTDLSTVAITPYIIRASTVMNDKKSNPNFRRCDAILAADGGQTAGATYWKLPTIKKGTVQHKKTYIFALWGCPGNTPTTYHQSQIPGTTLARCDLPGDGGAWTAGVGNLQIKIFEVDRTVTTPANVGAQFAHVASAYESALKTGTPLDLDKGVTTLGAFFRYNDAGQPDPTTADPLGTGNLGELKPAAAKSKALATADVPTTGVLFKGLTADGGQAYFGGPPSDAGAGGKPLIGPFDLNTIQRLSGSNPAAGTMFVAGMNYTFVLVGDPTESQFIGDPNDGGRFNTRFIHFLAFPNNPTLPVFE